VRAAVRASATAAQLYGQGAAADDHHRYDCALLEAAHRAATMPRSARLAGAERGVPESPTQTTPMIAMTGTASWRDCDPVRGDSVM
jgi:hypothetical protein